jgi:hypothetical protein
MKNYVINNGSFTAQGNFSGYTAMGERIHIYARQMSSLDWEVNEDVKYPFYAIAKEKEIEPLGTDGKPTGEKTMRLTALSVFKSKADITNARSEAALLDIEITKSIQEQAEKVGISQEVLDVLLAASV